MSCELTCEEMFGKSWEEILRSLVVLDENGCFALRTTADGGGGGTYVFPSNSGNVVYVSTGGNDGTGVVGNISKPFLTAQAGLASMNAAIPGTIIILSSTGAQEIGDVAYLDGDAPERLTIQDLCSCGIEFTGTVDLGEVFIETKEIVTINTDTSCTFAFLHAHCVQFRIPDTMSGSLLAVSSYIDCNVLSIEDNASASVILDVVVWSTDASIGVIDAFSYNDITPWEYEALLNQVDTDPPTAVVLKNTLGEVPTYGYTTPGEYFITSPGSKFVLNNTAVYFGAGRSDGGGLTTLGTTAALAVDEINFAVYSPAVFGYDNNQLLNTPIDIKVYPAKY